VEKLLEDAQIKLSVVASDIFGVSGRAMLAALIAGERDPKVLAQLARARLRAKLSLLAEARCWPEWTRWTATSPSSTPGLRS
jgi:transposase